jgi:hypothetical protein
MYQPKSANVKKRRNGETFSAFPGLTGQKRIVKPREREERQMKKAIAMTVVAAFLAGSTTVFAAGFERRQVSQQHRIHQGIRSGSLTPGETARLEREQFRTKRLERRLKADGKFTARDRARVHHRLNRSSRRIYRAKHNGRTRP